MVTPQYFWLWRSAVRTSLIQNRKSCVLNFFFSGKTPTPRQPIFSIFKVVLLLLLLLLRWPLESNAHQMRHVEEEFRYYNVGVLMASNLNYPFDLERCGPAVDMALEEVNEKFLAQHRIKLLKVQKRLQYSRGVTSSNQGHFTVHASSYNLL
ncbi:hypothetical protein HUJ05_007234 [Dendroctonus ponderosae]|nr:hypothetical protein HUJ05_007234 [Dendroctonus ponderosae]